MKINSFRFQRSSSRYHLGLVEEVPRLALHLARVSSATVSRTRQLSQTLSPITLHSPIRLWVVCTRKSQSMLLFSKFL